MAYNVLHQIAPCDVRLNASGRDLEVKRGDDWVAAGTIPEATRNKMHFTGEPIDLSEGK